MAFDQPNESNKKYIAKIEQHYPWHKIIVLGECDAPVAQTMSAHTHLDLPLSL